VSGTVSISARHVAATGAAPSDLTHTVKAICCRQTIASKLSLLVCLAQLPSTFLFFLISTIIQYIPPARGRCHVLHQLSWKLSVLLHDNNSRRGTLLFCIPALSHAFHQLPCKFFQCFCELVQTIHLNIFCEAESTNCPFPRSTTGMVQGANSLLIGNATPTAALGAFRAVGVGLSTRPSKARP
jgi:hypothetical protein